MDCNLPGSSLHGILQARVLEWVAISFSRGSSQPRDPTRVSYIPGRRCNLWATREVNKQGDNIQPWCTPFPIWNQSVVPCSVLTVPSWTAYRFLKRQVRVVWYSHLFQNFPQFIVIHTVKGFGIVNKAEIDAFLELSCLLHDPTDVGNLISGSSAFSKSSLNIWKFTVHVMLKPGLENFEHYWEGNRQEGQGSPNGGHSLQVSDIFISLKRQEETH